jgi:hypothetical protein
VPIVLKSGSLNLLEPSEPLQACNGIALPTERIALKFDIGDFHENLSIKIHILVKSDKNIGHYA